VELNAIPVRDRVAYLERKLAEAGAPGKVVPPGAVLRERLERAARAALRDRVIARIMAKVDVGAEVDTAMERLRPTLDEQMTTLAAHVADELADDPDQAWGDVVEAEAERLVDDADDPDDEEANE
jgi:hypothetical protein